MSILYNLLEFIATFVEAIVCYGILDSIMRSKAKVNDRNNTLLFQSFIIAVLIFVNIKMSLISNLLLFFVVFHISLTSFLLFRSRYIQTLTEVRAYYVLISIWDIFCMFVVSNVGMENIGKKSITQISLERTLFIVTMKIVLIVLYTLIKKSKTKAIFNWRALFILSMLCFVGMYYIQRTGLLDIRMIIINNWIWFLLIVFFVIMIIYINTKYVDSVGERKLDDVRNSIAIENYKVLEELYKKRAHEFHDFDNHIQVLKALLKGNKIHDAYEYIEELDVSGNAYVGTEIWSGNRTIDCILNCKVVDARKQDIGMEINTKVFSNKIKDNDICSILANLLDNAIEACSKINDKEKRRITVLIKSVNQMLIIIVKNSIDRLPMMKNGKIISTKVNLGYHGIGLESIRAAAEKYEGEVRLTYDDEELAVIVTLFCAA